MDPAADPAGHSASKDMSSEITGHARGEKVSGATFSDCTVPAIGQRGYSPMFLDAIEESEHRRSAVTGLGGSAPGYVLAMTNAYWEGL
jgi:hypothetical protein